MPAAPPRAQHLVPDDLDAAAVHHEHAHHVAIEAIALDPAIVAVHEVHAVAAALDLVRDERVARRVPGDDVARVAHAIAFDARVPHLPKPDRVAA